MKKLILLVCLLSATPLMARSFKENKIKWEDRPLTWDDFKGRKLKSDTAVYNLEWFVNDQVETLKVPHGKIIYYRTNLSLSQDESFIDHSFRNDNMLRFCQTGFNLLEVYRRQAECDYAANPEVDYMTIFRYYHKLYDERMEGMADSTNYGQNKEVMDKYTAEIDSMLALPGLDPTQIQIGNRHLGFDVYVGYNLRHTDNDFYTNGVSGINLGYSMEFSRHFVGMDANCVFGGKSKSDFSADYGIIDEGEKVEAILFGFQYGYLVNPKSKTECYPFINIGGTTMSGCETVTDEDGKKRNPYISGFFIGLGCRYDIPLYTKKRLSNGLIRIYTNPWGSLYRSPGTQSRFALQLRPQIVLNQLRDKWFPSFNLAVNLTWNFRQFTVKQE